MPLTAWTVNSAGSGPGSCGVKSNARVVARASRPSCSFGSATSKTSDSSTRVTATTPHIRPRFAHVRGPDRARRKNSEMTPTVSAGRTKVTRMKIGIQYHWMTIGPAKSTIPVLIGG